MGRMIAVVLLVAMVIGGPVTSHAANQWVEVAAKLTRSAVSLQELVTDEAGIQSFQTVCTAFAIDEQRQLFLTAQHCIGESMRLDWQMAWKVYENEKLDLAVVQSMGVRRPALLPRTAPIVMGLDIAAFGFAWGFETPALRTGIVSHPLKLITPIAQQFPKLDPNFMVVDVSLIGGMSGGPMVDSDGNVISINLMGSVYEGLGKPIDRILEATAPFWGPR